MSVVASYDHGSAQAIGIITQFICDTLTNKCKADQTAKDTCQKATTAANGQTAKTGAQADAFNAVFGITTKFADVASVDDQGRVVAGTGNGAAATAATSSAAAAANTAATSTGSTGAAAGSAIGDFGKCSVPQIEFGAGFDGRKETSFEPVDKSTSTHFTMSQTRANILRSIVQPRLCSERRDHHPVHLRHARELMRR